MKLNVFVLIMVFSGANATLNIFGSTSPLEFGRQLLAGQPLPFIRQLFGGQLFGGPFSASLPAPFPTFNYDSSGTVAEEFEGPDTFSEEVVNVPAPAPVITIQAPAPVFVPAPAPASVLVENDVPAEATYVASNRGVTHVAPLPGHVKSVISENLASPPGTI